MNYFYCPEFNEDNPVLNEEESRHCLRVLRFRSGDKINILDGRGYELEGRLIDENPKGARFDIVKKTHYDKPIYGIHLVVAPTKNMDRMEWMVEKTTEIGVDRISFISCSKSERTTLKNDRLIKKAISAMKQSGSHYLPTIDPLISYEAFIKNIEGSPIRLICHAEKGKSNALMLYPPGLQYLLLVGPEGDFSENELKLALENNFEAVTLGKNRLRTETAALVACTQLNSLHS